MDRSILKVLARRDYRPSNAPELLRRLGWGNRRLAELESALHQLERDGEIVRTKGGRYIVAQEANLVAGILRTNRQGKGFLQPDDPKLREVIIPESATSTAMHGDRVLARLTDDPSSRQLVGAVVRVLERKRTRIVGTLQRSKQFLFVVPDDPRMPHNIYVAEPRGLAAPVQVGDKVVVELREWTSRHTNPEGEIVEALGSPDTSGVDMLSILRHYQLSSHFPPDVLQDAEDVVGRSQTVDGHAVEADMQGRVDCRSRLVATIDPDDAKDFDDAISLERQGNQWRLWVHIADVSHYIQPGSALDREARRRGNSTYLVDRVIPMLPEALSNGLCSLNPRLDRLTKCVEFLLDDNAHIVKTSFYPSVIRAQRRFTYKEALAVLQGRPSSDPVETMLRQAHQLAQKLRRRRFEHGALDLDFVETKIRLDEHGRVAAIERHENDVSHQLIEEFMLLANEAAAARLKALRRPGIYRVHEPPNPLRLEEYRQEIAAHNIPCGNLHERGEVQKLLARLKPHPAGAALRIGLLKSLMRARYSTQPDGHYGLAKDDYTHFTSPIRRYADLVVHRALFDRARLEAKELNETAVRLSDSEWNSSDAERASKDVKMLAYLDAQLRSGRPQTYSALVTDVRNFGFFIDVLDLGFGGLVHLSSMEDDFYVFDLQRRQLTGRRTRRVIKAGEKLQVEPAKIDLFKKQVDFRLAGARAKSGRAGFPTRKGRRR